MRAGLAINGLAKKAGVSQTHLAAVERGDTNASPITIKKVADALDIRVADLLYGLADVDGGSG